MHNFRCYSAAPRYEPVACINSVRLSDSIIVWSYVCIMLGSTPRLVTQAWATMPHSGETCIRRLRAEFFLLGWERTTPWQALCEYYACPR